MFELGEALGKTVSELLLLPEWELNGWVAHFKRQAEARDKARARSR